MNNILALRNKLNLTQDAFADYCGLSRISIARYEANGKIGSENAEKIAKACNVSVDYVLGLESEQPDPAPEWNAEYPPGVALRTVPQPRQPLVLSDTDIARIAERVAVINREPQPGPAFTPVEQQLVDEFRMLSPAQRTRVQRMIASFLDSKFMEE